MKDRQRYNRQQDELLNIKTEAKIEYDLSDRAWHYHRTESTDYHVLDTLFKHLEVKSNDILVDMGAGTGRVLLYSALQLNIAVKGIEYLKESYDIALENIENSQKRHEFPSIQLYHIAVEDYEVSDKDTIFYFFNPFSLIIMRPVIYEIMRSVTIFERPIQLVFYYPLDECIQFIEERTPFELKEQIILPGHHKDLREKILIYTNTLQA